jgi:hypothetical protein
MESTGRKLKFSLFSLKISNLHWKKEKKKKRLGISKNEVLPPLLPRKIFT